jgi:hypothetical protein
VGIGRNDTEQFYDCALFTERSDSGHRPSVQESPGLKCSPWISARESAAVRHARKLIDKRSSRQFTIAGQCDFVSVSIFSFAARLPRHHLGAQRLLVVGPECSQFLFMTASLIIDFLSRGWPIDRGDISNSDRIGATSGDILCFGGLIQLFSGHVPWNGRICLSPSG